MPMPTFFQFVLKASAYFVRYQSKSRRSFSISKGLRAAVQSSVVLCFFCLLGGRMARAGAPGHVWTTVDRVLYDFGRYFLGTWRSTTRGAAR